MTYKPLGRAFRQPDETDFVGTQRSSTQGPETKTTGWLVRVGVSAYRAWASRRD
jgi:hypothetical protein